MNIGKPIKDLLLEVVDIQRECKDLKERIVRINPNEELENLLSTHLVLGLKKK